MSKLLKATHTGELKIGEFTLTCAVLEDGTRVLSDRSVALAFGVKGGGAYWQKKKTGSASTDLPEYLSAGYLQPFIGEALREKLAKSISYKARGGKMARGVEATVLPDICDVWIEAEEAGALTAEQKKIAKSAYLLLRGFAHVGIVALVDEATGYQYERDRNALFKILEAYVSKELLPWTKTFPDEFYKQLFRLNGWSYNPFTVKRPSVIGTWTNKLVYDQLPKGVLQKLKEETPRDSKGRRKHKYFQLLTEDIGNPHLRNQLTAVITLMKAAPNMAVFKRLFARAFGQQELDLDGE